jgi:hypothetical protein
MRNVPYISASYFKELPEIIERILALDEQARNVPLEFFTHTERQVKRHEFWCERQKVLKELKSWHEKCLDNLCTVR